MKIEPVKNPNRIISYWSKQKLTVAFIVVSGIIYNVGMLIGPIYQGKLIDALKSGEPIENVAAIAAAFIISVAAVQCFRYMKRFYIRRFANNTSAAMRLMLYNTIVYKGTLQLEAEGVGSLMAKAVSDVDACVEGMRKFTTEIFDTGVLMASYTVAMLVYDVRITVAALCFVPLAMLIAEKLKRVIYSYTSAYRKKSGYISGLIYDRVDNAMLYRVMGREEFNQKQYDSELKDYEKKAVLANIWENSMQPVYNVIVMIGIIPVFLMGAARVSEGVWTIGIFSTYTAIFTAMAVKASKAAKLFNSVQKAAVSWKRIKPFMKEYQSIDRFASPLPHNTVLTISHMYFSYDGVYDVLKDIDLNASSGEIIGITGPVACGKSTFGRMLLGEYDYRGSIEIDGRSLREYTDYERTRVIAYMGHNPQLLSDTIYNNITLGDKGDINTVIHMACLDKDLEDMDSGINTMVGNGGISLSGGQQARIALARTLYHRKKLIVLDDPFSAVDMATEKNIMENLKSINDGTIILIISHRLSFFEGLDGILLINKDGKCEYGTHKELMEKSPLYKELIALQRGKGENIYEEQ